MSASSATRISRCIRVSHPQVLQPVVDKAITINGRQTSLRTAELLWGQACQRWHEGYDGQTTTRYLAVSKCGIPEPVLSRLIIGRAIATEQKLALAQSLISHRNLNEYREHAHEIDRDIWAQCEESRALGVVRVYREA